MRALLLLLLLAAAACGGGDKPAPTCENACAPRQHCAAGACVCDEDFVDCDGNFANGCEPASTCGCKYEGDAAFCEKRSATCGAVAGDDNCGNRRVAQCGSCTDGLTCGAQQANVCGDGECRPQTMEARCSAEGWLCGVGAGADNCGTESDLACGECGEGLKCGREHICVDAGKEAYQPCVYVDECAPPLTCQPLRPDLALCLPTCTRSSDCTFGQRCAIAPGDDLGLCGNWRRQGETCGSPFQTPDFCWDEESDAQLLCMSGRCAYLCALDGEFVDRVCPDGMFCNEEEVFDAEYGRYVRYCEFVQP